MAAGAHECAAQRCSAWEWANPKPGYISLSSVTWGPAGFLATGTGGPLTSADGLTWVVRRTAPHSGWSAVIWDGSKYVAAGFSRIATSDDGFTWVTRYEFLGSPRGESIDGLAFNGTTYVAVGRNNGSFQAVLFTSADGITWTRRLLAGPGSSSSGLSGVVWSGTEFVAVGLYQSAAAVSSDGATWVWHGGPSAAAITTNGEWLVAVGLGQAFRSRGGTIWETQALPNPNANLYGVAWGRDRFVAVGERGAIFTSVDGRVWSDRSCPRWDTFAAVAFAADRFVVVGTDVLSSVDGEAWSAWLDKVDVRFINAVAGSGHEFVAVGDIESVLRSDDGLVWAKVDAGLSDLPLDAWLGDVIWTGTQFVAVGSKSSTLGSGGVVVRSPDGQTWSRVDVADNLRNVAWDGQRLVAAGVEAVLSSPDGRTWTKASFPGELSSEIPADVAGGGGRSVIALNSESVAVSGDGVTWSVATTGMQVSRVAWGGGRFVAWGWGVASSSDGVSWTPATGLQTPPAEIVWTGTAFAGWEPGSATWWTSPEGVTWSNAEGLIPTVGDARAFAVAGGTFVAAGFSGQITRAVCGFPACDLIVPSTGHLAGLGGTLWRTDLAVFNPPEGGLPVTVEFRLLPRGASVTSPPTVVRTVRSGTQLVLRDALYELFGADGAATLRLISWGGQARAWARTYNDAAMGTYGQRIPAVPAGVAQGGGDEFRLIGLSQSADSSTGFRTNLGLVNTSAGTVHVAARFLDRLGTVLGNASWELQPNESIQIDRAFRLVTAEAIEAGVIVVAAEEGLDKVIAFASVVDNRTGDPVFVEPSAAASVGWELWLLAVAHVPGLSSSLWRSDLALHNAGASAAEAEVLFLRRDRDNSIVTDRHGVRLEPGTSLVESDVILGLFTTTGAGTLRITPRSGALMARARTYDQRTGGTFGQSIAPCRTGSGSPGLFPRAWLFGLSQSAWTWRGFRTNIGLQNLMDRPASFLVGLFRGDGTPLGERTYTLRPFETIQRNEFFREVTSETVADGFALVEGIDWANFHAYASLIDNRTNDPVYLPACGP